MTALACPHYLFTMRPCGLKQSRTFWNKHLPCVCLSGFTHSAACWSPRGGRWVCAGARSSSHSAAGCPASPGQGTALVPRGKQLSRLSRVHCCPQDFHPTLLQWQWQCQECRVLLLWQAGQLCWALGCCWGQQELRAARNPPGSTAGTERAALPPVLLTGLFSFASISQPCASANTTKGMSAVAQNVIFLSCTLA